MKKNYLETNFIKFLIESEKEAQNEVDADEVDADEVDADDADEVIEKLLEKLKNTSKEYDDIIHGRK